VTQSAGAELPGVGEVFDAADAHLDDGVGEHGVVAGDNEVADPGEHEAAGDALALDLGDGGLGDVAPAAAHAEVDLLFDGHVAFGALFVELAPGADGGVAGEGRAAAAEVVTGGEVGAGAGEDDDLDRLVGGGLIEGGVQVVGELVVLGVAGFGAVLGDAGNAGGRDFVDDGFEGRHEKPPQCRGRARL
jgi:hypothetical protein